MKQLFPIIFLLSYFSSLHAQQTLTLQPGAADGKDCEVYSLQPNSNYVSDLLRGAAWTFSGDFGIERGLFQFDLSSIPTGSVIDSAFLFLYSPDPPTTQDHSGDNESYLVRITEDWNESSVTWNNQPSYTIINAVALPESNANLQDYSNIDVTRLVEDMIAVPSKNYGFMILLAVEDIFRRMSFCSSDYPNAAKHPKLIVHYTPPSCISLVLRPDAAAGKDCEVYSLQPSSNYVSDLLRGAAWTFGGEIGVERGLFSFDLSGIPDHAEINFAYLSLYSPDEPSTQGHSGENGAYLQRITSDWGETTVTWNNQPPTTTLHQVLLDESNEEFQHYENINVTTLVEDIIHDPANSFGFMLRLVDESIYRRLGFCSSDYPNPAKHPKLEICYTESVSIDKESENGVGVVKVYPNPFTDQFQVNVETGGRSYQLQLHDSFGNVIYQKQMEDQNTFDMTRFPASIYLLTVKDENNQVLFSSKVVKTSK